MLGTQCRPCCDPNHTRMVERCCKRPVLGRARQLRRRAWCGVGVLVCHLAVKVRPEFLDHNRDRVIPHLRSPHLRRVRQGSVGRNKQPRVGRRTHVCAPWMVAEGGDRGRHRATHNFREVELVMAGIGPRHKNPGDRISRAMAETPFFRLEEARILMQQRRQHCSDYEVLDGPICCGGSKTLSVTLPTLAKCRLTVFRLAQSRQRRIPRKLHFIECASAYQYELLLGSQRRHLTRILHRKVVRQRKEQPVIGFPVCVLARLVLIGSRRLLLRRRSRLALGRGLPLSLCSGRCGLLRSAQQRKTACERKASCESGSEFGWQSVLPNEPVRVACLDSNNARPPHAPPGVVLHSFTKPPPPH